MNWKSWQPLFSGAFWGALAFFVLRSVFSAEQAAFLALIVSNIALAITGLSLDAKQQERERFWVRIKPNWRDLLNDYGVVTDEAGWKKIQEYHEKHPDVWTVFRNGIGFTVLEPDLFYSNDHHYFLSHLDIRVGMHPVPPIKGVVFDFPPTFYVKRCLKERRRYWEFGLVTAESIKRARGYGDSEVAIACLPREFFSREYLSEKKLAALEKKLKEGGWKRKEREIGLGLPFEIEHKYVTLSYDSL